MTESPDTKPSIMGTTYTFRQSTELDLPAINDLYRTITGRDRSIEHARWLWRQAPAGPGSSWVIEHQDPRLGRPVIVGHHGVIRIDGECNGQPVRLGKTENTMVLSDHRRQFLYPRMELAMLGRYGREFDLIFSTRGQADAIRMRGGLGYLPGPRIVTETWARGLSGRAAAAWAWCRSRVGIRHEIGQWDVGRMRGKGWLAHVPARSVPLIAGPMDGRVRIAKTPDFLRWRYEHHPSGAYSFAELDGGVAVAGMFRGAVARIDELLPGDLSDRKAQGLWGQMSELLRAGGIHCLMIQTASDESHHHLALHDLGWELVRTHRSPGLGATHGIPVKDLRNGEPTPGPPRLVLGSAANEGP